MGCPHGFANENNCNLCYSGQSVKTPLPKNLKKKIIRRTSRKK